MKGKEMRFYRGSTLATSRESVKMQIAHDISKNLTTDMTKSIRHLSRAVAKNVVEGRKR